MFGTALGPCPVTFVLEVLGNLVLPLGSCSRIVLHLLYRHIYIYIYIYISKVSPLKAWCGPEGG